MLKNPVIAAWIAGGLIWGVILLGLGIMGKPPALDQMQDHTIHELLPEADAVTDAYERALDGDPWGDADMSPYGGVYRPAGAPDS